jgi:ABC-2 type transport system ATP-binding protein
VRLEDAARLPEAERILQQVLGAGVHNGTDAHTLTARIAGNDRIPEALSALASARVGVAELTMGQPSLDDVFFALTGKASAPSTDEARA